MRVSRSPSAGPKLTRLGSLQLESIPPDQGHEGLSLSSVPRNLGYQDRLDSRFHTQGFYRFQRFEQGCSLLAVRRECHH